MGYLYLRRDVRDLRCCAQGRIFCWYLFFRRIWSKSSLGNIAAEAGFHGISRSELPLSSVDTVKTKDIWASDRSILGPDVISTSALVLGGAAMIKAK